MLHDLTAAFNSVQKFPYTLTVKRYNRERHGRRSFSVAGPSLWNALPSAIRNSVSLPAFRSSPFFAKRLSL